MAVEPTSLQNNFLTMSTSRRAFALIGIAGAMALLVVIFLWANQPTYSVLYSNLSSEDAGSMVEKLKAGKVPYQISGADTVMVPEDRVYELRLQMASQGLPQGGAVGFELFDRNSMGMTDFVQKLNYRRALEGELARTIGQLSEVQKARVHLMIPERTLFSERKQTSSASVILKMKGGQVLAEGQIQGVIHLVASSVEGLNTQDVTVVDTHGNMLSRVTGGSHGAELSNFQVEYQQSVEKGMEERIQSMLERAVGIGKVIARVSTVLNFKQVETTEEKFDPDSPVVRSEQRLQENSSGNSSTAGGVPGVLSNLPGARAENPQTASGKGTSSQNKKTSETINYDISKSVSRIVEPIGTIQRLSVAVLIDGSYAASGAADKEAAGASKYVARTPEEMKKYEEIVKKAVGFNPERGDQVEVVNTSFEGNAPTDDTTVVESGGRQWSFLMPFIKYGVMALSLVLVFLFIVKPLMTALTAPATTSPIGMPLSFPPGMDQIGERVRGGVPQLAGEGAIRDQVIRVAQENPQQTAKLIKAWISEK